MDAAIQSLPVERRFACIFLLCVQTFLVADEPPWNEYSTSLADHRSRHHRWESVAMYERHIYALDCHAGVAVWCGGDQHAMVGWISQFKSCDGLLSQRHGWETGWYWRS